MAETRFIKTVAFGGYDKTDVDKRLEYLYSQVHDLRSELRDAKLALDKYKKGTEEEKVHESLLATERAKLTEVQVKNETISEKLKTLDDENKNKENEIKSLKEKNQELEKAVSDLNEQLIAFKSENEATALSNVFVAAKSSADMLVENAKKQADDIEADSKKLAENMITDANNKAAQIIYEAEKEAAEINANALNKAEEMKVASGNMKAVMISDISKIGDEIAKVKLAIENFAEKGYILLEDSESLLRETTNELGNGGVPVFKNPETYTPEYPEKPQLQPIDNTYTTGSPAPEKKKNEELEKLQAMAMAIGGGDKKEPEKKSGSMSLEELAKQAASMGGESKPEKKSGSMSLEELAKQAASMGGESKPEKKSGSMSLEELAKQAAAMGN